MPQLRVQERARHDIESIALHIMHDNLGAAMRFVDAAQAAFELLASMPGAGSLFNPPLDEWPELRFWPIRRFRNYLVIYRPLPDGIHVLRVIHGAQDMLRLMQR